MALKKPLVLNDDCEPEELQPGDTINTQPDTINKTFTSTSLAGSVQYIDGAGSVDKAQANASGTSKAFGFAQAGVTAAATGTVVIDGTFDLPTATWDAVIHGAGTGGLTPGETYYMSPDVAGEIVPQSAIGALLTTGEYCARVGQACTDQIMRVEAQFQRIKKA